MRVLLLELVMNECNVVARIVEDPTPEELKVMIASAGQFAAVEEENADLEAMYTLLDENLQGNWMLTTPQSMTKHGPFDHVIVFGSFY